MRSSLGVLCVVLVAVVATAVPAAADQQLADREAKLRQLIIAKLGTDAEGIRVTLMGNKAILTGKVTERSTQELAKEVGLTFAGVTKVDNQLEAVKGVRKVVDLLSVKP